ncbi:MAG: response regulator [Rhodospirillales bacterium]|nr:response regulator [Rhodospirillales bacterium]MCB9995261.1 response regulator [Rhodospirillales bacterium]
MHKITENPEQHIQNYISGSTVKGAKNIGIMRFALSRLLDREALIYNPEQILETLGKNKGRAEKVCNAIFEKLQSIEQGYIYLCQDNDIIVIARFKNQDDANTFKETYQSIAKCLSTGVSETSMLTDETIERYKGIVQERLMNVMMVKAYIMMADHNLAKKMEAARKNRRRPLVMIADHEVQNASFICKLIETEFDVLKVSSGPEAIIEYMKKAPDSVVLDLAPPGLGGMDVSVCIKAIDLNAHIIMMSVDVIEEQIIDSFNSGASDFLKKPFNQKRFVAAIKRSNYINGDKRKLEEMESADEVFLF